MLSMCRKCREPRDVVVLRLPAEGNMPAHSAAWCGPCIEEKIEQMHNDRRTQAAQIALLREEVNG